MDSSQFPLGLDPYLSRQHLLHHTYSPLISVQSSYNADLLVQETLNNPNLSFLQFVKPYGNNAKHTIPGQSFKITNSQLITKNYPSFPIRFELCLPELLSILNASSNSNINSNSSQVSDSKLRQLFSISSLEVLLKHRSDNGSTDNLYLDFFSKVITSNKIVPFETFNHPISQIFVIDYHRDTVEVLRKLIVEFRNYNFPKFFQIDDLLIHLFILYDPEIVKDTSQLIDFQNLIRKQLSIASTLIPFGKPDTSSEEPLISLSIKENSTIEEDLQRISLNDQDEDVLEVPQQLDLVIRKRIFEFINKLLIPHMEKKIRIWDDLVLSPKKSITGRFFSVSKMLFNNSNSPEPQSQSSNSFNYSENYYHKSSSEQIIRKLADWSLILKDFKYSYSTYDLIKKDYTNDKAWAYVASAQEICVVSLLLAQTQQTQQPQVPDRNTFRKIRHDIIEPYCDNLLYTFKSRLNLKSYGIKALLVFTELLLCISIHYNNSWWWNDLIEKYLCKCLNEFDKHLTNGTQVIRALLYERLGYSFGKCFYLGTHDPQAWVKPTINNDDSEGLYVNPNKLHMKSAHLAGLTRYRRSSMWYILSMKEWLELKNYDQIEKLLQNIRYTYNVDELTDNWYDRQDLLLGFIKRCIQENKDVMAVEN